MKTTPLSFLLDNMDVYRDFANLETQYKVRAIDTALRSLRQGTNFPWNLKKGTLRVFDGVTEYPIASDHDELGYIDVQNLSNYNDTARFYNTSLQQFYEMVNSSRNLMSDIWKNGTRLIGLNYKSTSVGSTKLDSGEDSDNITLTGDASGATEDTVVYKKGNGSIRFTITNSANSATIKTAFDSTHSDSDYKAKYHFKWIYLDAVPTSIEMRLQTDDTNYLYSTVTAQFDGTAFAADDWNLIAHDLNIASAFGTFNSASIASEKIILTGAATGTYYIDQSDLRQWELMDYWYYSFYNIVSNGSSTADKEFFISTSESAADIDVADALLGEPKWFDKILWDAMRLLLGDIPNENLLLMVKEGKKKADSEFADKYPTITPLITTQRYRFNNDPGAYSEIPNY